MQPQKLCRNSNKATHSHRRRRRQTLEPTKNGSKWFFQCDRELLFGEGISQAHLTTTMFEWQRFQTFDVWLWRLRVLVLRTFCRSEGLMGRCVVYLTEGKWLWWDWIFLTRKCAFQKRIPVVQLDLRRQIWERDIETTRNRASCSSFNVIYFSVRGRSLSNCQKGINLKLYFSYAWWSTWRRSFSQKTKYSCGIFSGLAAALFLFLSFPFFVEIAQMWQS